MLLDFTKLNQKYFEAISRIPRESGNERAISDYIANLAKSFGYSFIQDEFMNVIVFVPASKGYEDKAPVILQAHTDMVCVKTSDSTHDFSKDPLELYIDENNYLRAKNTTLGADDGYGVAYMLAIMEDSCEHPRLELVFTAEEETSTYGAKCLDATPLTAKRMISMDTLGEPKENVSVVSCFTSDLLIAYRSLKRLPAMKDGYLLTICGTEPLREGSMVHPEEYNPIKILARLLHRLDRENEEYYISDFYGGTAENMYPLSASAFVYFPHEIPMDILNKELESIKDELFDGKQKITLDIEKKKLSYIYPETKDIITFLYMLPSNTLAIDSKESMILTNMVGKVEIVNDKLIISMSNRAKTNALKTGLNDKIHLLCQNYGFQMDISERYSSWEYKKNSYMREKTKEVMREFLGLEMVESSCPGGLEATRFIEKIPDLDVVMFTPFGGNCHSVNEFMSLSSFDLMYDFLKELLGKL